MGTSSNSCYSSQWTINSASGSSGWEDNSMANFYRITLAMFSSSRDAFDVLGRFIRCMLHKDRYSVIHIIHTSLFTFQMFCKYFTIRCKGVLCSCLTAKINFKMIAEASSCRWHQYIQIEFHHLSFLFAGYQTRESCIAFFQMTTLQNTPC